MREIPILFTTEMVQAILRRRKVQTRRILNPQPPNVDSVSWSAYESAWFGHSYQGGMATGQLFKDKIPKYDVGDLLYVRETFAYLKPMTVHHAPRQNVVFKTGGDGELAEWDKSHFEGEKWRPCIHMPKAFSRIWLKIVSLDIERVQDITDDDINAEGVSLLKGCILSERQVFSVLWNSINGERMIDLSIAGHDTKMLCGWDQNPLVWVIGFERIER